MNIEELIDYLLDKEKLKDLYRIQNVDLKSEAILIYMKDSVSLDSETVLFEIEDTDDVIIYKKNETNYIQFFPIEHG